MVPSLRKRLWYQRYLDKEEVELMCCRPRVKRTYNEKERDRDTYKRRGGAIQRRDSESDVCGIQNRAVSNKKERVFVATTQESRRRNSSSFSPSSSSSSSSSFDSASSTESGIEAYAAKEEPSSYAEDSCGKSRMLMREWIATNADDGRLPGLRWLDKTSGLVQIDWKHGSRSGWSRHDVEVFESWAIYTGKFDPDKSKSDCKRWKANFRCALNSLSDVVEVKDRCNTRCKNAYKVYRMLPNPISTKGAKTKKLKSLNRKLEKTTSLTNEIESLQSLNDFSFRIDSVDNIKDEILTDDLCPSTENAIPEKLGFDDTETSFARNEEENTKNSALFYPKMNPLVQSDSSKNNMKVAVHSRHFDHSYANTCKHLNVDSEKLLRDVDFQSSPNDDEIYGDFEFNGSISNNFYIDLPNVSLLTSINFSAECLEFLEFDSGFFEHDITRNWEVI